MAVVALVVFVCLFYIYVLASASPRPWNPPACDSFWETVRLAFFGQEGQRYNPTGVISLASDYFTFGRERPLTYTLHSMFGMLCRTIILWLLLRRLHLWRGIAFIVALAGVVTPCQVEVVTTPILRWRVAAALFAYTALLGACNFNSRRWKLWMAVAAVSCFVALGASVFAAVLIPLMPILAYALNSAERQGTFSWRRLVVPEITAMATLLFVVFMS